jgi:hypothetical protein
MSGKDPGDLVLNIREVKMKEVTRKEFLKTLGLFILGCLCFPLERWLNFGKAFERNESKGLKEAKYYKEADTLSG